MNWFALASDGTIQFLGKCVDFDQADRVADERQLDALWLGDEETARQWYTALGEILSRDLT